MALRFRPRIEDREISRTARGDVNIVQPHGSFFSRITLSATKGHTLFLNAPPREHDCREVCFIRHCHSGYNTLRDRQSEGCISKNEARRQIAARSSRGQPKKAWSASAKRARSDARAARCETDGAELCSAAKLERRRRRQSRPPRIRASAPRVLAREKPAPDSEREQRRGSESARPLKPKDRFAAGPGPSRMSAFPNSTAALTALRRLEPSGERKYRVRRRLGERFKSTLFCP